MARPAAGETPDAVRVDAVAVERAAVSGKVKLADAQLALARSYEAFASWL